MSKTYRGKDRQKLIQVMKKKFNRIGKRSFLYLKEEKDNKEVKDKI